MVEEFSIQVGDGVVIRGERLGVRGAPVLVFSNSLGCTRDLWRDQLEALVGPFDIVLYDTRGHGASDVPDGAYSIDRLSLDVLDVLDALSIGRMHFCGLSLGGMTGQSLAVRAPDRLLSLTLAATSSYMGPPSAWQARINSVRQSGIGAISDSVRERWFAPEGAADAASVERAMQMLNSTDPSGYAGCCAAIRDMDLRAMTGLIGAPTCILAGAHDMATPLDHARRLEQTIPDSTLNVLEGGHLLNLEQPLAFAAALNSFISDHV